MLERELQAAVIELARTMGWRCAHFRAAMTAHGWRTPVSADGAGFPDLCMVRDRVVFAELKTAKGKLSEAQLEWRAAIEAAEGEYHLWTPDDWTEGRVDRVLIPHREAAA